MRLRYEERSKDTWLIVIDKGKDPLTGKRLRDHETVKGKKKDAEKRGKQILMEYEKGAKNYVEGSKMPLSDLLYRWLDVAKLNIVTKTYRKYKQVIEERLIPNLGNMPIGQLNTTHIQDYFNILIKAEDGERCDGREGQIHPKTLSHYLSIIKLALEYARTLQYITINPANAVVLPTIPKNKSIKALDENQVKVLLEIIKGCRIRYSYSYYEAISLALATGMRRNEILGLRWQDINFETNKIRVFQSLTYNNGEGYGFKEPKTVNSIRTISVDPDVLNMLKKLKIKQDAMKLINEDLWEHNDLVFCHDNGKPWHQDAICGWFYKLLKRNEDKLPRIRFHDLRHTHATLLLKGGENIKVVAERLGHASIRTTMDVYAHLLPDMQEKSVIILKDMIKF